MSREVTVLFFASLAEKTGCRSATVELDAAGDVATLWGELERRYPELAGLGFKPLVACDRVWVRWDGRLDGVREVAFLPPISGG